MGHRPVKGVKAISESPGEKNFPRFQMIWPEPTCCLLQTSWYGDRKQRPNVAIFSTRRKHSQKANMQSGCSQKAIGLKRSQDHHWTCADKYTCYLIWFELYFFISFQPKAGKLLSSAKLHWGKFLDALLVDLPALLPDAYPTAYLQN